MIRRYLPKSVEELIHWYERYVSPFALVGGFLLDTFFLLDRVDTLSGNLLLLFYLALAGSGIIFLNVIEAGRIRFAWILTVSPLIPVVVQFAFGGLFSAYLSLYGRSASPIASWVFVLAIAGLLIGNERFRRLYIRLPFQISIYFFTLLSFFSFFVPVVIHKIGPVVFLASGILSLGIVVLFLYLLAHVAPEATRAARTSLIRSIAIIYLAFNALYFADLIPPLPLALKDAGVYHSLQRVGGGYVLEQEHQPLLLRLLPFPGIFHRTDASPSAADNRTYVFAAVFAPTGLSTSIVHEWQYYDSERGWVTESRITFNIVGGRDGGYRGYSLKSSLHEGKWRVNVLTAYGQTIGRIVFRVEHVENAVRLQSIEA
ncbi:DUF2914 domain-containing protein [Candidatus Kaiserbacteria bacterium]|nr:DUF2914 domain-containing protein [Candidatus Kaiserbacteria bacterium]